MRFSKKITIKNPACKIWYPDYNREFDKKDLTICGYENSLAQEWALKKDYKFKKSEITKKLFF